jgi:uncharacterized protein YjiK
MVKWSALIFIFFAGLLAVSVACRNVPFYNNPEISYRINAPDKVFFLPRILTEISGITLLDSNIMACVQDEKGTVFFYDLNQKDLINHLSFWKKGDYEDILFHNDVIYVVKSNGNLYTIKDYNSSKPVMEKHSTPLCKGNDVEGLTYDDRSGTLWMACKGDAGLCEEKEGKKAIYAFSLEQHRLIEKAVMEIDVTSLTGEVDPKRLHAFAPSGIAIHPITKEIYIISSVGRLLLIFSPEKKLLQTIPLQHRKMTQPEGICFDKAGNLYISNEGRGGAGNIMYFEYQEPNEAK